MTSYRTELSFSYPSPTVAERVASSIRPEAGAIEGDRTSASLSREGDRVLVTVEADDLTALRAGQNTWSTLVEVAERAAPGRT